LIWWKTKTNISGIVNVIMKNKARRIARRQLGGEKARDRMLFFREMLYFTVIKSILNQSSPHKTFRLFLASPIHTILIEAFFYIICLNSIVSLHSEVNMFCWFF
jgi:hypothetical protein